ncbi:hypothetical protein [Acinetobacter soli]|uniref:hypothetical protein n=1 Tax=Acinetobacter soli TaxID=487316 RepID=UPI00125F274E|nr:hypothetical protein [Acinetobacter soli]
MPIAKHTKSLVERLNLEIQSYNSVDFKPLTVSQGYDLLACLVGLNKHDFGKVGFVSSSLFLNVPTYQPVGWDHHPDLDKALEHSICKKTGLNSKEHFFILGGLVAQLTMHGFKSQGDCIRHPDQLIAMLRELYDTDESVLEHLDSVVELIENLEYVESKKSKDLKLPHYWILHWCYAVLRKHETAINIEIKANNKILNKQQALLNVYKPYFERGQTSLEKYYRLCIDQNFDQAVDFNYQFKAILFTSSYDQTHAFAIPQNSDGLPLTVQRKTSNLFYNIDDIHIGDYETWNSFYRLMNEADRVVETDEEQIVLILLQRLFRKDALGRDDTGYDFIVIHKYQYLFSGEFEQELKSRYPLFNEISKQHQLNQRALSIFSQMYRHYLEHKNFDTYTLPRLTQATSA